MYCCHQKFIRTLAATHSPEIQILKVRCARKFLYDKHRIERNFFIFLCACPFWFCSHLLRCLNVNTKHTGGILRYQSALNRCYEVKLCRWYSQVNVYSLFGALASVSANLRTLITTNRQKIHCYCSLDYTDKRFDIFKCFSMGWLVVSIVYCLSRTEYCILHYDPWDPMHSSMQCSNG